MFYCHTEYCWKGCKINKQAFVRIDKDTQSDSVFRRTLLQYIDLKKKLFASVYKNTKIAKHDGKPLYFPVNAKVHIISW